MKTEKRCPGIVCLDPLPKGLVLAKPVKQDAYDEEVIYQLEKEGNLIITRKRDGWKLFAAKENGKWKIYTDGMNEVRCVGHINAALGKLKLPNRTILVGEGIIDAFKRDEENFLKVSSILQSKQERAVSLQKKYGLIKFMIFDVVVLGGQYKIEDDYETRSKLIGKILGKTRSSHIQKVPVLKMSFDNAKKKAVQEGWEGLVLYARNFSSSYRLDGKDPARPKGCYKWKPIYEDDFIVREFILSPHDKERVKEVVLSQIDPKSGKEFNCGKFGLFPGATRKSLKDARYPIVIQLKFEARFRSGKLRNARFMRFRLDKKPESCVAPKSFESA